MRKTILKKMGFFFCSEWPPHHFLKAFWALMSPPLYNPKWCSTQMCSSPCIPLSLEIRNASSLRSSTKSHSLSNPLCPEEFDIALEINNLSPPPLALSKQSVALAPSLSSSVWLRQPRRLSLGTTLSLPPSLGSSDKKDETEEKKKEKKK